MELAVALRRIDAPKELIAWVEEGEERPYESCTRGSWLVWLAGVRGVPPYALLEALLGEVELELERLGEGSKVLSEALENIRALLSKPSSDTVALTELADVIDAAADDPPSTFRTTPGRPYASVAHALAWVARSAEGLEAGRARHEARRLDSAQHRAALLGAGTHAMLAAPDAVHLDVTLIPGDPLQEALLYVFAAAAEAAAELSSARGLRRRGGAYRDAPVGDELAEALRVGLQDATR